MTPGGPEVEITGHAGLRVRAGTSTVLVDPWLGGSAYWRSWWQYPPPPEITGDALSPKYVMLTHHHFDHFHFPSMRRIDRSAQLLIPKFAVDVMAGELDRLGFSNVTELEHGRRYILDDGIEVASYQYGLDDTTIVIKVGDLVVFDVNDCKIRGRALESVLKAFGRPTFLLKNYSAAQAYPHCYRADDHTALEMLSPESYIADFLETARDTHPRFAVPFASMVCFLHPDTVAFNATVVTPERVADAFGLDPIPGTDLVVLSPGDHWSEASGFVVGPTDWSAERDERIAALVEAVGPRVAESLRKEGERTLDFEAFSRYFTEFVSGIPWLIRRMFRRPICFAVDEEYWVVDVGRARVLRREQLPDGWANVITIAPGLLDDAIDKRLVNLVHISMRLRIVLAEGGLSTDLMFWALLIIFELGYFPLSTLEPRRVIGVAWARRREFLDMAVAAATTKGSVAERISASFMASPTS
jgi:UDP-MurNAc hydroxylase